MREKRHYIGFFMILMQRLVTGSTRAIATTIARLVMLWDDETATAVREPPPDTEWSELDGQEQLDLLLGARLQALRNEHGEVGVLLELARRCMASAPDAKAEAVLDWMYRLQQESGPTLKFLIFTEFVPTQEMLCDFLTARGFSVTCVNGSMDMERRHRVQQEFAGEMGVLVSTDAGGEGLNLQFCHVVVNYDRHEAIRRMGLPAIRQHRLSELEREVAALGSGLAKREYVAPELDAIVLLRVESAP